MKNKNIPFISGWNLTKVISVVLILNFILILSLNDYNQKETISILIRTTAKFSVALFLLAFSASSFYHFSKNNFSKWMLKNRRYIGVSFAISHYLHLLSLFLMTFHISFNVFEDRGLFTTIGGAIGYLFITIMTITSFDKYRKIVSPKNWKRIHTIGSYYLWIIFAKSYIPRITEGSFYTLFAVLLITTLLMRIWKKVSS